MKAVSAVRAYYKRLNKSYWGHICHVDRGDGKPLCENIQHRTGDVSSVMPLWVQCADNPSCRICLKKARKLDALGVEA